MAESQSKEFKFPTEIIDLPSGGKLYPKESPLSSGKLELKYMTTREEDILTSQNLIKKGVVVDRLLDSSHNFLLHVCTVDSPIPRNTSVYSITPEPGS